MSLAADLAHDDEVGAVACHLPHDNFIGHAMMQVLRGFYRLGLSLPGQGSEEAVAALFHVVDEAGLLLPGEAGQFLQD